MEKEYMGIKDASIKLGVTKLTLRNWDRAGKLTAKRHPINNYRVYLKEDIDEIIRKIESGEKPIKYYRKSKVEEPQKMIWHKIKVIHIND